jgi:hypothetical protein
MQTAARTDACHVDVVRFSGCWPAAGTNAALNWRRSGRPRWQLFCQYTSAAQASGRGVTAAPGPPVVCCGASIWKLWHRLTRVWTHRFNTLRLVKTWLARQGTHPTEERKMKTALIPTRSCRPIRDHRRWVERSETILSPQAPIHGAVARPMGMRPQHSRPRSGPCGMRAHGPLRHRPRLRRRKRQRALPATTFAG